MACPETRVGPDWEAQFATNHLGHFALDEPLWPRAGRRRGARVSRCRRPGTGAPGSVGTTCSSSAATTSGWRTGRPRRPTPVRRAPRLARPRSTACGRFAVHPGGIMTPLQRHIPQGGDGRRRLGGRGREPDRPRLQDARAGRGDDGLGGGFARSSRAWVACTARTARSPRSTTRRRRDVASAAGLLTRAGGAALGHVRRPDGCRRLRVTRWS